MKVVSGSPVAGVVAAGSAPEAASKPAPAQVPAANGPSAAGSLQSSALQPAFEAARLIPDVDQAKVAELRDALTRGALPFDATKLAALIERYHRLSK